MFHRDTLAEFNTWHTAAKISDGITGDGRVGFVNGVLAPNNQKTTAYAISELHPSLPDDYIWEYGKYIDNSKTVFTEAQLTTAGFFTDDGNP